MHRQHNVLTPSSVPDPPVFVSHTLTACPSAVDMLRAEAPVVAVLLHSPPYMPASEAPRYQTVCASLLPAFDVIERCHLNPSLPSPLGTASRPNLVGGADDILSKGPAHLAVHVTGTSPVPSAGIFTAPPESPSPMAGTVSARVSGSPTSSVLVPSTNIKTGSATIAPFRCSL